MKNCKMVANQYILISLLLLHLSTISSAQELRLDHAIKLCPDLPGCIEEYTDLGFSIKVGELHKNGLRNAHIKFSNASSLELMTLEGPPSDIISNRYDQLLRNQTVGAYLALTGLPITQIEEILSSQDIKYEVAAGKLWSYISFNENSELAHIFFIVYHKSFPTPAEYTSHENGFDHIESISTEGTPTMLKLLTNLGLEREEIGYMRHRFTTQTGAIIIHEIDSVSKRPKILELVLGKSDSKDTYSIKLD